MTTNKEHSIILPEWKIRAILDHGATQFRVVAGKARRDGSIDCPHHVGQRLWVKEAWCHRSSGMLAMDWMCRPRYRAGGDELRPEWGFRWRPARTMPRWASRLTLEVTEVRVQRVQEISGKDLIAEGWPDAGKRVQCQTESGFIYPTQGDWLLSGVGSGIADLAVEWFANQWDADHGPGAWERNGFVWPVTFKRVNP